MKWLLIDEREDHRDQFSRLMGNHGVDVVVLEPKPSLDISAESLQGVDGFILDYALHEQDPGISYSGTTLAAHIKERNPASPVVILSAKLGLPEVGVRMRRTGDLVDSVWRKDSVERNPGKFVEELRRLVQGFMLKSIKQKLCY